MLDDELSVSVEDVGGKVDGAQVEDDADDSAFDQDVEGEESRKEDVDDDSASEDDAYEERA